MPLLQVVLPLLCGVSIALIGILTAKFWMQDLGGFVQKIRTNLSEAVKNFDNQVESLDVEEPKNKETK